MKYKKKKFFYKKHFGQCFLKNKKIIDKIIKTISPEKKKYTYCEIGPGLASLTKPISIFLNKLFVIDIDKDVFKYFKKKKFFSNKVVFFLENVLKFNFLNIFKKKKIKIFGNLPYNISTILILKLLKFISIIKDMNFMFQKEVALRLFAKPGNKNYGRLSIIVQKFFKIFILFDVNPSSFYPKPKVFSTFVRLEPIESIIYNYKYIKILEKITFIAFQQRRKMIKKNFSSLFSENFLLKLGINPNDRAENIPKEKYYAMSDYIIKKNIFI
ncbi:16S rRNA (adenine(1518)-N(6)/adenine(1519)-N(6))-dimethyltransferase RsmA [Buchnera aphidicola]|uniref:16S rRNA (adenine(1518)-N(6)/adenine(1519)-N(6))- dimethyltransferase RsmA n=1 Tax=Buchnera aphidicola TaxID=9 RepID=UPI0030ECD322